MNENDNNKLIQQMTNLSLKINKMDEKLSEIQERASLKVSNLKIELKQEIKILNNIRDQIKILQNKIHLDKIMHYVAFLELKTGFNILKNKMEMTTYLIMVFTDLRKKYHEA